MTTALLSVSEAVSRLTSLDEVLNKVVEIAPRVLNIDYCAVFLWSEEDSVYRGAAVSGLEPPIADELLNMRLRPEEVPDLEWVRRLGHCAVIGPRDAERFGVTGAPLLLTAPLLSGGQFYGVLQFSRRNDRSFTQSDLRLADGIAGQTAVAIERARLVDQSRRLVRAVESTGEAVLITDSHRRVVYANQAFLQMFDRTWEEIAGQDTLEFGGHLTNVSVQDVENTVREHAWRGEALARRKDGSVFPVALNASLIRSADNRIEGAVAILEDITAEKQMQEQMARADRLAAAGELAAGVAHEVNNALVGILGQAELGHTSNDVGSLRQSLLHVETQGRRIADILQDLLGFARPQTPQRQAIDLAQLVRDTLALMAHDLGRHHVHTETVFASALRPVSADAKQLQQVLVNLFTNAMQAMQPAGGVLSVRLQRDGHSVRVDVHDDGPGVPADVLPRVFDPFFSTKSEGTGLGLSVSYAIARAHGGELAVQSSPTTGTTFTLRLPVTEESESIGAQTVLLVDDDDDVADTLRNMLSREGLNVQRVASGTEALQAVAAQDFDAIFLDVRLPDISGPEIYARLAKERPDLAKRVAFVSGGLWRSDNRALRDQLPPQPMLSKPCTAAQIREVLRLLRDARAAA
ncbi:MAG: PAS domain S-box protein [Deltaproteobacteria bacterium]|nr:PAS domain S-box protein [Deltaproteobacteria bacterium]